MADQVRPLAFLKRRSGLPLLATGEECGPRELRGPGWCGGSRHAPRRVPAEPPPRRSFPPLPSGAAAPSGRGGRRRPFPALSLLVAQRFKSASGPQRASAPSRCLGGLWGLPLLPSSGICLGRRFARLRPTDSPKNIRW